MNGKLDSAIFALFLSLGLNAQVTHTSEQIRDLPVRKIICSLSNKNVFPGFSRLDIKLPLGNPLPPLTWIGCGWAKVRFSANFVKGKLELIKCIESEDQKKVFGNWLIDNLLLAQVIDGHPDSSNISLEIHICNLNPKGDHPMCYTFWIAN